MSGAIFMKLGRAPTTLRMVIDMSSFQELFPSRVILITNIYDIREVVKKKLATMQNVGTVNSQK